jgi:hypothetical protein
MQPNAVPDRPGAAGISTRRLEPGFTRIIETTGPLGDSVEEAFDGRQDVGARAGVVCLSEASTAVANQYWPQSGSVSVWMSEPSPTRWQRRYGSVRLAAPRDAARDNPRNAPSDNPARARPRRSPRAAVLYALTQELAQQTDDEPNRDAANATHPPAEIRGPREDPGASTGPLGCGERGRPAFAATPAVRTAPALMADAVPIRFGGDDRERLTEKHGLGPAARRRGRGEAR